MALPLLKCINSSNAFVYLCLYNKNLEAWIYINSKTLLPNILEAGKFMTTQVWWLVRSILCFQSGTFFFLWKKVLFLFFMYMYVQICGSIPIKAKRGFQHSNCEPPIWVLRTELGSSGRAASEFKCWAISPNPHTLIFFLFPCMVVGRRTKGFTDFL